MSVKQSYLKDENDEIFSPIVSTTSIYDKTLGKTLGGVFEGDNNFCSETIFCRFNIWCSIKY